MHCVVVDQANSISSIKMSEPPTSLETLMLLLSQNCNEQGFSGYSFCCLKDLISVHLTTPEVLIIE